MRRISFGLVALAVFFFMFTGCATVSTFKPVDLNPKVKAGDLVQKTDNLAVLLDKSASMDQWYAKPPNVELANHLTHAKSATKNMAATIPDMKLNAGLKTFWSDQTAQVYGMKAFEKNEYIKVIDGVGFPNGKTPTDQALLAAGNDLKGAAGRSAIVIFSDFDEKDVNTKATLDAAGKLKADFGENLCIYTVQVGNVPGGKVFAQKIVQNAACGDYASADDLANPAAMAAFVQKVLLEDAAALKAKKAAEEAAARAKKEAEDAAAAAAAAAAMKAAKGRDILGPVHFDFDKSVLRPQEREILKKHVAWLTKEKDATVLVEGHCDEVGTTEYNLALGERRAAEVKKYLVNSGIAAARISTISFGEERPADPGHSEEAHAKNRRAEFVVK
jgi:OOP family OmpA-OmpF porin